MWASATTMAPNSQLTGSEPAPTIFRSMLPTPAGIQELAAAFPNSPAAPLLTAIGPSSVSAGNPVYSNIQNIPITDQIDPNTGSAFDCVANPGSPGCTPIEFGSVSRFVTSPFNDYEATGRVDVKLTNQDNFFGRYVFQQQLNDGINFGLGIDVGDFQTIPARDQQIGLDWVRNFSNTSTRRVSATREHASFSTKEVSPRATTKTR